VGPEEAVHGLRQLRACSGGTPRRCRRAGSRRRSAGEGSGRSGCRGSAVKLSATVAGTRPALTIFQMSPVSRVSSAGRSSRAASLALEAGVEGRYGGARPSAARRAGRRAPSPTDRRGSPRGGVVGRVTRPSVMPVATGSEESTMLPSLGRDRELRGGDDRPVRPGTDQLVRPRGSQSREGASLFAEVLVEPPSDALISSYVMPYLAPRPRSRATGSAHGSARNAGNSYGQTGS